MTDARGTSKSIRALVLCVLACSGHSTTRPTQGDDKNSRQSGGQTTADGRAGSMPGDTSGNGGSGLGGFWTDPCVADPCRCNPCGAVCPMSRCECNPCADGCQGNCGGRGGAAGGGAGESGAAGEPVGGEGGASRADCNPVSPPGTEMICGSLAVWACPGKALSAGVPSFCTSCSAPMAICSYTLHSFEGDTCSDCCCL